MRKKDSLYVLLVVVLGQVIWFFDLELSEQLGLEGVVLALAAVVLAIQHSNELNTVADKLQGIAQSIPTRGIGVFPSYMTEVAKLVDRADESITILCDTPAHGAFSNTGAFEEYWSTLHEKMVDKLQVECTFFDAAGREQLHRAQITDDEVDWGAWQDRNRRNSEAFDRLARYHGLTPPSNGVLPIDTWAGTPDDYVQSMMAINKHTLSIFRNHLTPELLKFDEPLHEGPTVYFWLRDRDQEAVFVIVPVRGIGVRDLAGFHTEEPELIRALGTVYTHRGEGR